MLTRHGYVPGAAALVTGAASGIGAATVAHLLERDVRVAMVDNDHEELTLTAKNLRAQIGADKASAQQMLSIAADVADPEQMADAFAQAICHFDTLHHVVAAAGVLRPALVHEITPADWHQMWQTNVTGVLHALQGAQRWVEEGGSIVVISSNAALVPRAGLSGYAATKAAVSALTRSVGLELATRRIRCNLIAPGTTRTTMLDALWADPVAAQERALAGEAEKFRLGIPLGRIAEPADIAANVAHLLSEHARHITMQQLVIDGGASL